MKAKWNAAPQKRATSMTVRSWRPWHSDKIKLSMKKGQMPTCKIVWVPCVDGGRIPICINHGQVHHQDCWVCREVSDVYQ